MEPMQLEVVFEGAALLVRLSEQRKTASQMKAAAVDSFTDESKQWLDLDFYWIGWHHCPRILRFEEYNGAKWLPRLISE